MSKLYILSLTWTNTKKYVIEIFGYLSTNYLKSIVRKWIIFCWEIQELLKNNYILKLNILCICPFFKIISVLYKIITFSYLTLIIYQYYNYFIIYSFESVFSKDFTSLFITLSFQNISHFIFWRYSLILYPVLILIFHFIFFSHC